MVLHPLTEVIVRMFVPVGVGSSQLMVHVLRDCKGGNGEVKQDQADSQTGPQHEPERLFMERSLHGRRTQ